MNSFISIIDQAVFPLVVNWVKPSCECSSMLWTVPVNIGNVPFLFDLHDREALEIVREELTMSASFVHGVLMLRWPGLRSRLLLLLLMCLILHCSSDGRINTSFRLRLNSLLATYSRPTVKGASAKVNPRPNYPPLRQRGEREPPRSIQLKPQEYFLLIVAVVAISALVIYNLVMYFYDYYVDDDDDLYMWQKCHCYACFWSNHVCTEFSSLILIVVVVVVMVVNRAKRFLWSTFENRASIHDESWDLFKSIDTCHKSPVGDIVAYYMLQIHSSIDNSDGKRVNFERNFYDALAVPDKLGTGIDVNLKINR